jgi:hypothetical protein
MQKYTQINTKEEVEQYIVRLPSLSFYFMAVTPQNSFIEDALEEYYSIAMNITALPNILKKMHIEINFNKNN